MPRKPYQSDFTCPACGKRALVTTTNTAGELAGVRCKACKHSAELRPFPMPGAQGYFVGSDGRAYSIRGGRGQPGGFRALTVKLNRGFPRVRLMIDGKAYYPYLAPAVLSGFGQPRPPGYDVRHKDGNAANCALDNIEWAMIRSAQVSAKRFVEAWQTSSSPQEVADKLGMTRLAVAVRASKMRKHGVPLKSMGHLRGAARIDWEELTRLAEELANGQDAD